MERSYLARVPGVVLRLRRETLRKLYENRSLFVGFNPGVVRWYEHMIEKHHIQTQKWSRPLQPVTPRTKAEFLGWDTPPADAGPVKWYML